jgi:sulfiredoxin
MMRQEKFAIADIYVPTKRRATLKPDIVQKIAQNMLEVGQQASILARRDGDRFCPRTQFASPRSMRGVGRRDDL